MSISDNSTTADQHEPAADKPRPLKPPHKHRSRRLMAFGVTAFVMLAIGSAAGAGAVKLTRPSL